MLSKMLYEVSKRIKILSLYLRVGLKQMTMKKFFTIFKYFFSIYICKRQIPWVVEFSVTYRCQCRCLHCSVANYLNRHSASEELTTEQIKNILMQIRDLGIPKVDFFGGEPLIREDIVELCKFGSSIGLFISITTNALVLTRTLVKDLKRMKVSYISISLDSVDEKKHDRLRRMPGLYQKILNAVNFCHEEGLPCLISTYITRDDIIGFGSKNDNSNLSRIITLSKKTNALGIRILFPIISGKWVENKNKALNFLEQNQVLNSLDYSFAFIEGAFCIKNGKKICQSLMGKMFNISPYGDVQICITYPKSFGNIKNKNLKEILNDMYSHSIYLKNRESSCCDTNALLT